jgi:hypothetical protein
VNVTDGDAAIARQIESLGPGCSFLSTRSPFCGWMMENDWKMGDLFHHPIDHWPYGDLMINHMCFFLLTLFSDKVKWEDLERCSNLFQSWLASTRILCFEGKAGSVTFSKNVPVQGPP